MIVARDLSKSFGKVVAVDSVNFRIPRGQVVGFLGPNGAGKTTTIRMIAGFLPPTSGSVEVDGIDAARHSIAVRARIGYLPESNPLYTEMRVVEYLRFRARLHGMRGARRRKAVDTAMARCWLTEVRRRPIGHLSKGYRQRVGLAAALVHEPPVLILDEPTVGLDPAQIREVRGLIRELAGKHTVLLSTHILPEAELTCDEIVMMAAGRVLKQGAVTSLRAALASGSPYCVETDSAEAEKALRALPSIADVQSVTLGDGWFRLSATAKADTGDRRELIGRTLRKLGAGVRELTREAPTLEQMFVQLLAGEGGGPRKAAAPPPPTKPGDGRADPLPKASVAADPMKPGRPLERVKT
jgi:ABC-2 type transport system ATP-binding protein